jgi:hypothetical protein
MEMNIEAVNTAMSLFLSNTIGSKRRKSHVTFSSCRPVTIETGQTAEKGRDKCLHVSVGSPAIFGKESTRVPAVQLFRTARKRKPNEKAAHTQQNGAVVLQAC